MIDRETMLGIIGSEAAESIILGDQSVPPPVLEKWFHTVGVGQYFGTVKWHLFEDCGHLRKRRPHWRGPIHRWGWTTEYTRVMEFESEVPKYRRCQVCEKRHLQNVAPSSGGGPDER